MRAEGPDLAPALVRASRVRLKAKTLVCRAQMALPSGDPLTLFLRLSSCPSVALSGQVQFRSLDCVSDLKLHGKEWAYGVASTMFPQNRPPTHLQAPPVATAAAAVAAAAASVISTAPQSLKLTYPEILDRIKEEFQFLQNQYHSLKLECEKLATEKTEIQRHYVMYYEMSYGLNIEMHKQTEIAKRLNVICAQLIPFLSQEHQQQVVQAVERAKQVTMAELNVAIGAPEGQPCSLPS
uniref:Transducin-like enhancer protein 1 n=1 Tax=Sphaerodactylus townsendi TaxID=933632 RepID=A0ACB8F1Q6_9SAUR